MTSKLGGILCAATLAALASFPDAAAAQSRADTLRMSCAAAKALVARHGGIVLATRRSLFDRFVASRAHCMPTEMIEHAFVPTADNRQCFIGYTCREHNFSDTD
ncbi:MAG: hypothetical protein FJX62_19130 [Alphaproteobacteria bacterium]|nr:hypothetical protein [Alphaproteobacteria bacterium]